MTTTHYCQCGKIKVICNPGDLIPTGVYGDCCSRPFPGLRRWFRLRVMGR